jgi:hypothetical protein
MQLPSLITLALTQGAIQSLVVWFQGNVDDWTYGAAIRAHADAIIASLGVRHR